MYNPSLASLIVRIGLAVTFAYAAIGGLVQPGAWISYVPDFSNAFIDPALVLDILSVLQLVLVAWLLTGRFVKFAAIASIGF